MARISKRTVDAVEPGGKPHFLWDDRVSGFGLLTLPSGVKSFIFQFRNQHGRTYRLTVGRYGPWTPDEARRKADELRQAVKDGRDPRSEKREARAALTVSQLLALYRGSSAFAAKSPARQEIDRGRMLRHLEPLLGTRVVNALRREDIAKALRDIKEGRTAKTIKSDKLRGLSIIRGGEAAARDCIKLLRTALNWGVSEGLVKTNAALGVALGQHRNRTAVLADGADYEKLFAAIAALEEQHRLKPAAADAIRLLALCGCRRGEVVGLRWKDVDLRRAVIVLPAERHKAGKLTGVVRTIALPSVAQEILARQPTSTGEADGLVFPGVQALSKTWKRVRIEAGFSGDLVLHSLRHSWGTTLDASAFEVMQGMGHADPSVSARYLHFQNDARVAIAERGASAAIAGLAAATGSPKAEIVALPRRGK